ncbi:hypothetical protein ACN38_g6997 [Penicillium nordicum]|uniref:Uncharacterized protein n=1 Tax=Penicillium nordicum TaxID=229535 RepID=A0A0M8NZ17_9EURO|nr:hypothetical protein ACN38_g6997 [Penicillium nordicum]
MELGALALGGYLFTFYFFTFSITCHYSGTRWKSLMGQDFVLPVPSYLQPYRDYIILLQKVKKTRKGLAP